MQLGNALDLGAGVGHRKRALAREQPRLANRGVDLSPVACARYGHVQASIASYRVKELFDLVICQGVLQYLDDKDAAAALRNIGAMAGGLVWYYVRPPVEGLEYEMDVRGAARELVL